MSEGYKREVRLKLKSLRSLGLDLLDIEFYENWWSGDARWYEPLQVVGPLAGTSGKLVLGPEWIQHSTCGGEPLPRYNGDDGLFTPGCIAEWAPMDFSQAWAAATAESTGVFRQLSDRLILTPPNLSHKYQWYRTTPSRGLIQALASPGTFAGAQEGSRTASAPRRGRTGALGSPRARERQRGYETTATEVVAVPDASGGLAIGKPPTEVIHREVPTKRDKKTTITRILAGVVKGYHTATEIKDLIESLADAIPGKPCSKLPGFQMALCVIDHFDEIDPQQAAVNIIKNEIEDQLVGRGMGQLGKLTKAGGPKTVQMTTPTRSLQNVTLGF